MTEEQKPLDNMLTKEQSALEVVTRESFNRNMFLFLGSVSFVGVILNTLNNTSWGTAVLFGSVFISVYLGFKSDKEIDRLKTKYDTKNSWGIWTIQKILKRNSE